LAVVDSDDVADLVVRARGVPSLTALDDRDEAPRVEVLQLHIVDLDPSRRFT
jgi:hypothetical protein